MEPRLSKGVYPYHHTSSRNAILTNGDNAVCSITPRTPVSGVAQLLGSILHPGFLHEVRLCRKLSIINEWPYLALTCALPLARLSHIAIDLSVQQATRLKIDR